jgi:hypothetical protein
MDKLLHIVHHIDLVDIYMLMLLFWMHHILLLMMNMYPNDIDKQMNHFQERKYNYHVDKYPVNGMDQLFLKVR